MLCLGGGGLGWGLRLQAVHLGQHIIYLQAWICQVPLILHALGTGEDLWCVPVAEKWLRKKRMTCIPKAPNSERSPKTVTESLAQPCVPPWWCVSKRFWRGSSLSIWRHHPFLMAFLSTNAFSWSKYLQPGSAHLYSCALHRAPPQTAAFSMAPPSPSPLFL